MIETERLILRPPEDRDRDAIAALNADPRVGEWLAGVMTREESDALVDRVNAHIAEHGFGFWAVESIAPEDEGAFLGFIGMAHPTFLEPLAARVEQEHLRVGDWTSNARRVR